MSQVENTIAIDIGFGYTKYATKRVLPQRNNDVPQEMYFNGSFPSVVKKGTSKVSVQSVISASGYTKDFDVVINGNHFYVGELATLQGGEMMWSEQTDYDETYIDVIVGTALHQTVADKNSRVEVILGLPVHVFKDGLDEKIAKMVKGKEYEVTIKNETKKIVVEGVSMCPQGYGAFIEHAETFENFDKEDRIALIDIGERTVDYLVIEDENIVEDMTESLKEDGMNYIYQDTTKRVNNVASKQYKINKVESGVFDDKKTFMTKDGEKIRFVDFVKTDYEHHAKSIASKIRQHWGSEVNSVDYILITGGGAKFLYSYFQKEFPNVKIQDECQFGNANGYLRL